jgi:hypothetical protein
MEITGSTIETMRIRRPQTATPWTATWSRAGATPSRRCSPAATCSGMSSWRVVTAAAAPYGVDGRVSLQSRMRLRSANSHVSPVLTNVSR